MVLEEVLALGVLAADFLGRRSKVEDPLELDELELEESVEESVEEESELLLEELELESEELEEPELEPELELELEEESELLDDESGVKLVSVELERLRRLLRPRYLGALSECLVLEEVVAEVFP